MLKNLDREKFIKIASICVGVVMISLMAVVLVHGQEPPGELTPPGSVGGYRELPSWVETLVNLLATVAGVIAVFFLIFAGYRYVTAGGDAEQAGAARTAILNSIIGIVVILAAWALVRWLLTRLVGPGELQI